MPASELSAFTHVFRADIATAVRRPRVMTRTRRAVSCVPCRTRKLRCDKQHPVCGSCEQRRTPGLCRWDSPPGSLFANPMTVGKMDDAGAGAEAGAGAGAGKNLGSGSSLPVTRSKPSVSRSRKDVLLRLQKLEEQIRGLEAGEQQPPRVGVGSPTQTESLATTGSKPAFQQAGIGTGTGGHLSSNGSVVRYVGATHWAAILASLHEIQGQLEEEDAGAAGNGDAEMVDDLFFGPVQPITIREIMTTLPTQMETDQMLGVNDKVPSFSQSPVIHTQQFRRQYEAFWVSPYTTSMLWISILLSTLATAVLSDIDVVAREVALSQNRLYTSLAARCLVAGEYLKAKRFSVEALVCHGLSRMGDEGQEGSSYLWSVFGLAARLAQRMGYHRDPANITPVGGRQRITPFQAEMRRRVWSTIEAFDLLFSFPLGMPPVIYPDQCDAGVPSNLHDEDFDENTNALPPSRPEIERTKALYFRYKCRLVRHLRRIVLHALLVTPPTNYRAVEHLSDQLERIRNGCPPPLRVIRLSDAGPNTETGTVLHNMALEIMYLKARCILHRPYLTTYKTNPSYERSRISCRQAALRILDLRADMEAEARLDGNLFEKGYLLKSLSTHDFLIAAMILCLDLHETVDLAPQDREIEIFALQCTYAIWSSRFATTTEAAHATRVLGAMLRKVIQSTPAGPSRSPVARPQQPLKRRSNLRHILEPVPELAPPPLPTPTLFHSPGLEKLRASENISRMEAFPLPSHIGQIDFSDLQFREDGFEGVMEGGDVDWNLLDSYIMNRDTDSSVNTWTTSPHPPPGQGFNHQQAPILPTQQQQSILPPTHADPIDPSLTDRHRFGNPSSMPGLSIPWTERDKDPPPPLQTGGRAYGFSVGDLMNP